MQIVLLNGGKRNMVTRKEIDRIANLWQKTKDPKYKDLWYKYIKEWAHGSNNSDRWNVSSGSSNEGNAGKRKII